MGSYKGFDVISEVQVLLKNKKTNRIMKMLLKKYFGFEEFRPLQGEIISNTLAGRVILQNMRLYDIIHLV